MKATIDIFLTSLIHYSTKEHAEKPQHAIFVSDFALKNRDAQVKVTVSILLETDHPLKHTSK